MGNVMTEPEPEPVKRLCTRGLLVRVRTSLEEFGRRPNFFGSTNEVPSALLTHQSLSRRKAEVTRVSKEIGQVRANQKRAKSDAKERSTRLS